MSVRHRQDQNTGEERAPQFEASLSLDTLCPHSGFVEALPSPRSKQDLGQAGRAPEDYPFEDSFSSSAFPLP